MTKLQVNFHTGDIERKTKKGKSNLMEMGNNWNFQAWALQQLCQQKQTGRWQQATSQKIRMIIRSSVPSGGLESVSSYLQEKRHTKCSRQEKHTHTQTDRWLIRKRGSIQRNQVLDGRTAEAKQTGRLGSCSSANGRSASIFFPRLSLPVAVCPFLLLSSSFTSSSHNPAPQSAPPSPFCSNYDSVISCREPPTCYWFSGDASPPLTSLSSSLPLQLPPLALL